MGSIFEGPTVDAAGHGLGGLHALMAEPIRDIEAAHTVMAEADDVVVGVEFLEIGGNGAHGNEHGAFNVAEGVFVGFADVDEEEFIAPVKALFHFASGDFEIVHAMLPERL